MKLHNLSEAIIWIKAGEFLAGLLQQHSQEKVLLMLSGGSSVRLYSSIKYQVSGIRYNNLVLGQIDERFQPGKTFSIQHLTYNKKQTNSYQIDKTGLWEWCKEKGIPCHLISQEGTLDSSADEYNRTMEKLFNECTYKIAVLGIGEDGHTAGLLPHYRSLWDIKKYVAGYENVGKFPKRISITPYGLKQLDQAVVVASGEKKLSVINQITNYESRITNQVNQKNALDDFPAKILNEIPRVDIFSEKPLNLDYHNKQLKDRP